MSPSSLFDRVFESPVDYITLAVPFFLLMILLELALVTLARRDYIRLNDAIADLSCGTLETTIGIFLKTLLFAGYVWLFENFRLLEMRTWSPAAKWMAAGVLFLAVDFCFYWFHRFAHEMAAPWATHVVHHSSEDMNLIVALRQSTLEDCMAWMFYLPLAVIGFPPLWYAAAFSFNLLWQFWCHTRVVGKLGPLEWVFNTPSHHRVHHARNPQYLDKNYAGTLIIWDRMFGTFALEQAEPVYGITKPLASWNPIWANLHYWIELAQLARRAPFALDKVKVWFMPLGWTPRGLEPARYARQVCPADIVKYNARAPRPLTAYVFVQFLATLALSGLVTLEFEHGRAPSTLVAGMLLVCWGLLNLGALMERRRWGFWSELARLSATAAAGAAGLWGVVLGVKPALAVCAAAAISTLWLLSCRRALTAPAFVPVVRSGFRDEIDDPARMLANADGSPGKNGDSGLATSDIHIAPVANGGVGERFSAAS